MWDLSSCTKTTENEFICKHPQVIRIQELNLTPSNLEPVKITNLKLDELNFANHKLNQLDDLLDIQLKKPFIVQHSHWYTVGLSAIGSIVTIILLYNILKWCGLFNLLRRLLCCTKEPRTLSEGCCIKLFNTNINTPNPITQAQFEQILEEEAGRSGLPSNRSAVEFLNLSGRRSTRTPSVHMD